MYHEVMAPPNDPYAYLYVTPARFAREMAALRSAGYCAITLQTALALWTGATHLGCRPLILRFDDGYGSVFQNAYPVLQKLGWPGNLCQQVQRVNFPGGLTAAEIHTLLAHGWDLADHGYAQPELDLVGATAAQVHLQVVTSRQDLAKRFGTPVDFYCWPLGYYDRQVVSAVRAAGFTGALGVGPGDAEPAVEGWWRLDAVPAFGWMSTAALLAEVRRFQGETPAVPPTAYTPANAS